MSHQAVPASFAPRGAIRSPLLWGIVVGLVQAATPLAFWWLESATVDALGLVIVGEIATGMDFG